MTDNEEDEIDYGDEEGESSSFFRWLQAIVVLFAFGGFFGLAWYAYRSGDTTDDKDVELIKVEKTPVKEAPENPGGMQIPNQDKTVYSLIDNNNKTDKPVVERIMPATEEPVNPDGGSQTWMSDKLKGKGGENAHVDTIPEVREVPEQSDTQQFKPGKNKEVKVAQADTSANAAPAETPQLAVKEPAPTPAPAAPAVRQQVKAPAKEQDTSAQEKAEEKTEAKMEAKAPASAPAVTGKLPKVRVQLGALGSEDEAEKQWQHLAKKFPDDLGGKQHYIVRVTVNGKVYYRLQAAPFDSAKAAQSVCANLSGSGQACILAKK